MLFGEAVSIALQSLRANKLRDYPMPPADLPLIPQLRDLLG